ncbi:MAG: hypothetical protein WC781_05675 [Candidatus Pacearchaeota archaeon]|jgi:hypothetical protein
MKLILNTLKRKKEVEVKDIFDAVKTLNKFVDKAGIKSSDMDFGFGNVLLNNKQICEISYNGMVINMEERFLK